MLYRDFWGVDKRKRLLASLDKEPFNEQYIEVYPAPDNRYSFRQGSVDAPYRSWPRVIELSAVPAMNGLMEKRAGALIDIEKDALEKRMRAYFDPEIDWEEYEVLGYGLIEHVARFDPEKARKKALKAERFSAVRLVRYTLRPFDNRWCYYTGVRPVWNEPRPDLWNQHWAGNSFLMTRPAGVASPEGVPFFFTKQLGDNDALRGHAYYFPTRLKVSAPGDIGGLFNGHESSQEGDDGCVFNLSDQAKDYLQRLKLDVNDHGLTLWMHVLAIGFSQQYLSENADGVRENWPRIPLPVSRDVLLKSANLGRQLAELVDPEVRVKGVTAGTPRPELRVIANVRRLDNKAIDIDAGNLKLAAGWGHEGRDGAVMPGKGKLIDRPYTPDELGGFAVGASELGLTTDQLLGFVGKRACDIYLNDQACWRNIPLKVWEYTIGGYQVIKKWLSYREATLLDRSLTADEAREVTHMTRRLAAICLMQAQLDTNYDAAKASTYKWSVAAQNAGQQMLNS